MMKASSFSVETEVIRVESVGNRSDDAYTSIMFFIFLSVLWTLFLVCLPVVADVGPDNYYEHHPDWYTGNDVIRFIEPIGGLLLNCVVLYKSKIFRGELSGQDAWAVMIFVFGCALYVQGGAFHSASNMYKNSLETIQKNRDDDYFDPLHHYIRTVWQHGVSHYIYATGLAIMHAIQVYSYRELRAPDEGLPVAAKGLLVCATLLLAFLLLAVALQFPSGTIVGFLYLILYGFGVVGMYLVMLYRSGERKALTQFGHLPVVHYFATSYALCLFALVVWICAKGGFVTRSRD